jgi:hypothetical protein
MLQANWTIAFRCAGPSGGRMRQHLRELNGRKLLKLERSFKLEQEDLQQGQANDDKQSARQIWSKYGLQGSDANRLSSTIRHFRTMKEGEEDAMLEEIATEREIEQLNADKEEPRGKWRTHVGYEKRRAGARNRQMFAQWCRRSWEEANILSPDEIYGSSLDLSGKNGSAFC